MSVSSSAIIAAYSPSGLNVDVNKQTYIDLATQETSSDYYGSNYNTAVALLALHKWALAQRKFGEVGSPTQMAEGDVRIGFQKGNSQNADDLNQTQWGVQLIGLRRKSGIAVAVAADVPAAVADVYFGWPWNQ